MKENKHIPIIENDVQDRNSEAWIKLCELIDRIAEEGQEEFFPYEELGNELYVLDRRYRNDFVAILNVFHKKKNSARLEQYL